jgi:hypothetical protein
LELGVAAANDMGHEATALELVSESAAHCRKLALNRPCMKVVQGDFYIADLGTDFDVVCYWDGFGIGTDSDQRRLLSRVREWLRADGCALIDIYTPWYAASTFGKGWQVGMAAREYGFGAMGCRWLDTWRHIYQEGEPVTQSLRCYSPPDLELLLEGTRLKLDGIVPGQGPGTEPGSWSETAELCRAISYTAKLAV